MDVFESRNVRGRTTPCRRNSWPLSALFCFELFYLKGNVFVTVENEKSYRRVAADVTKRKLIKI